MGGGGGGEVGTFVIDAQPICRLHVLLLDSYFTHLQISMPFQFTLNYNGIERRRGYLKILFEETSKSDQIELFLSVLVILRNV